MQLLYALVIFLTTNINLSHGEQCVVSRDHKNYTCVGVNFRNFDVGKIMREEIARLDITDCKETTINEEALQFPNAEFLKLSCGIETIHVNGIRNLVHLKELDLGNNFFSSCPDNVFQSLQQLNILDFSNNNVEELTRNLFTGLNNLKVLLFSNNMISTFDMKTFDTVSNLEEISLKNNRINVVPARLFSRLGRLRIVDLSHNDIEDLGDLFLSAYTLEYVNLSYNKITELSENNFIATNTLKRLDLSNNKLSVLNESVLKLTTLEELHLQNNQLSLFEVKSVSLNRIPLKYLDLRYNRLVFLEDNFIKILGPTSRILVNLKVEGNPWDCNCYHIMEIERGDLPFQLDYNHTMSSYEYDNLLPVCVTSPRIIPGRNGCFVYKNKLEYYYKVYQKQIKDNNMK